MANKSYEEAEISDSHPESGVDFESRKIAKEKLDKLTQPDFKEFVIRFVNEGEYEQIMSTGIMQGREVARPGAGSEQLDRSDSPSFSEYVNKCKTNWAEVAHEQTDWGMATMSMSIYKTLLQMLSRARIEIKQENGINEEYQTKVKRRLRDLVLDEASDEGDEYHSINLAPFVGGIEEIIENKSRNISSLLKADEFQILLEAMDFEVARIDCGWLFDLTGPIVEVIENLPYDHQQLEELKKLAQELFREKLILRVFGKEKLELIKEWIANPESIDLRSIFNTIAYNQIYHGQDAGEASQREQYHMALVLSYNVLADELSPNGWGRIKEGGLVSDYLLGVICTMPNKELVHEVVNRASSSGDNSCPVFDNQGRVVFP